MAVNIYSVIQFLIELWQLPWMRWCKAVNPCESWTLISQPVWRRCILNWETKWPLSEHVWTREHVEQWDKMLVLAVNNGLSMFMSASSSKFNSEALELVETLLNFRDSPPSRQNSNKGLAEVKPIHIKNWINVNHMKGNLDSISQRHFIQFLQKSNSLLNIIPNVLDFYHHKLKQKDFTNVTNKLSPNSFFISSSSSTQSLIVGFVIKSEI